MSLETERLLMRKFQEEDFEALVSLLTDPKVMEYSLTGPLSRDKASKYFNQRILAHYDAHGFGPLAIVRKDTESIIGLAGPLLQEVDGDEYVEIVYRIASSDWGRGYATEALEALRDDAFSHLDVETVIAILDPSNSRAVRVAEKGGFKLAKETLFHGSRVGVYEISRIEQVPFSQEWQNRFEEEKRALEKLFDGFPVAFHHIGSTSIPGCFAKPKIDILGITPDITAIDTFDAAMEEIGYSPLGEYGVRQRRFFSRVGKYPVNLHIFEDSDPESARHLRFRDFLRNHPDQVEAYSKLKCDLAKRYPGNMCAYCLGKEAFIKNLDYQAALADTVRDWQKNSLSRKKLWSKEEILNAMEANMHLNMTYFAKYLPGLQIEFQPDVTVVASAIPDDTFNYVIGANFTESNAARRVEQVIGSYRKRGAPFSWWVGERDTPRSLSQELERHGLSPKEDDIGMYLPLEEYDSPLGSAEVAIERVLGQKGLRDFAKVFAELDGYPKLYEDLYCQIPEALIVDGSPFEMYVGYLNGVPVLTGILVLHANVGGIYFVMTDPSQRRKGFGTYMMRYLLQRAKEKGYPLATLQASADGRGLYEGLGFQPLCRFVEYG